MLSKRWRQSLSTSSAQPPTLILCPRALDRTAGVVSSQPLSAAGIGGRTSTLMMDRLFSAREVRFGGRGTVLVDSSDGRRSRGGETRLMVLSVGETFPSKERKEFSGEVIYSISLWELAIDERSLSLRSSQCGPVTPPMNHTYREMGRSEAEDEEGENASRLGFARACWRSACLEDEEWGEVYCSFLEV